ncbi:hypothetical protein IQ266_10210 [filamentous cyanobacterium LEGE 11480]|uniref:Restriction endonuclease n=1 Tax=Romeriopsis navalis LEGE 11480 TaxID=2777977 RepID=A0A928VNS0_9CYAN|nr:McrC family protein [Romeriopsis navalis]MBE9030101.1 hypothetical protein [Romeriopsis navalis LEGE 11480]
MRATPTLITCFEYEFIPLTIDDRLLRSLTVLENQVGQAIFTPSFQQGKTGLKAKQFVGVFQLEDLTIQVLPKLYKTHSTASPTAEQIQDATGNLFSLLQYDADLPKLTGLINLQDNERDFFELLIRLFATNLRSQWQQGAFRNYQSVEAVLPVLKGQWRLTDQLRHPARQHQFAVTYDEFTADNRLNQVFRYVVERLWSLTRDHQNRRTLSELRIWMDEVTLLPALNLAEVLALSTTRMNQRFEPLLNLARLFLAQGSLQLAAGNCRSYGLTFDMNQLFEQFVANFLKRHQADLPAALRQCEAKSQVKGRYFAVRSDNTQIFQLRPDFAFSANGQYQLIIDTKYKRLNVDDRKLGISSADMYQMAAYAQRFECNRILLLYPQTAEILDPIRESWRLNGCNIEIQVATIDLQNAAQTALMLQEFADICGVTV